MLTACKSGAWTIETGSTNLVVDMMKISWDHCVVCELRNYLELYLNSPLCKLLAVDGITLDICRVPDAVA